MYLNKDLVEIKQEISFIFTHHLLAYQHIVQKFNFFCFKFFTYYSAWESVSLVVKDLYLDILLIVKEPVTFFCTP